MAKITVGAEQFSSKISVLIMLEYFCLASRIKTVIIEPKHQTFFPTSWNSQVKIFKRFSKVFNEV